MIKRKRENSNYFTHIKSNIKVICKEKYIIKFHLLFKLIYIYIHEHLIYSKFNKFSDVFIEKNIRFIIKY